MQSADHGESQAASATTCRQVVQDDLRPWELKPVGQDLGFPGSQVPKANPIGNRPIGNLEDRGMILDPIGRLVAMGARVDLLGHGLRQDKLIRQGSQEIETVDAGEENQR